MNIYASNGFQVVCADNPNTSDNEKVSKHLEVGKIYTVQRTIVSSWSTDVWLREIPGVSFGSSNFNDLKSQSAENDAKHPDWAIYRY
jgi:hypothetical protein